jgi:hypothetical protein
MKAKFVNESIIGAVLTTIAIWYLLNFIKELLTTPEQKLKKLDRECFRDIYYIIKSRINEPEMAPTYSDKYFFHEISFPAEDAFHDYVIKVNKETKYLNVEIPNIQTRSIELNDDQYNKFIDIIKKLKNK